MLDGIAAGAEYQAARRRVRQWFRQQVVMALKPVEPGKSGKRNWGEGLATWPKDAPRP